MKKEVTVILTVMCFLLIILISNRNVLAEAKKECFYIKNVSEGLQTQKACATVDGDTITGSFSLEGDFTNKSGNYIRFDTAKPKGSSWHCNSGEFSLYMLKSELTGSGSSTRANLKCYGINKTKWSEVIAEAKKYGFGTVESTKQTSTDTKKEEEDEKKKETESEIAEESGKGDYCFWLVYQTTVSGTSSFDDTVQTKSYCANVDASGKITSAITSTGTSSVSSSAINIEESSGGKLRITYYTDTAKSTTKEYTIGKWKDLLDSIAVDATKNTYSNSTSGTTTTHKFIKIVDNHGYSSAAVTYAVRDDEDETDSGYTGGEDVRSDSDFEKKCKQQYNLGWLVCPVLNAMAKATDSIEGTIDKFFGV